MVVYISNDTLGRIDSNLLGRIDSPFFWVKWMLFYSNIIGFVLFQNILVFLPVCLFLKVIFIDLFRHFFLFCYFVRYYVLNLSSATATITTTVSVTPTVSTAVSAISKT